MRGISYSTTTQQFLYSPFNGEVPDVRVVLSNTDKQNRDIGGMYNTDQCSHHVAHRVALGDDKPVKMSSRSE